MELPPKEKERDILSRRVGPLSPVRAESQKVAKDAREEEKIEPPMRASDLILASVSQEVEERYRELVDKTIRGAALLYPSTGFGALASCGREFLIRTLDVVVSLIILFLTMPAVVVITLLIKMFSPGPVLYKQKRVGKDGRIFTLYKFRTMIECAGKPVLDYVIAKNDSRVTPVGRFLRRTRLDELPQFFNVLRGEMSLVGPYAERPYFVKRHRFLQGTRLAVKPGLTSLAYIRSFYDLKPEHKIKYDYFYIQKRSLLLNICILLKTVPIIFSTEGGW